MGDNLSVREYLRTRASDYKQRYFTSKLFKGQTPQEQAAEFNRSREDVKKLENAKRGSLGNLVFGFLQTSGILPSTKKLDETYKSVEKNPNNQGLSKEQLEARANHERKAGNAMDRFTLLQMLLQGGPQIWASFTQEGFFEGCLTTVKSIASPIIAQKAIGYAVALCGGSELGIIAQLLAGSIGFPLVDQAIRWLLQPFQNIAERLDGHAPASYPIGQGLTTAAQNSV